jgi:hypothetical protein
MVFVGSIRSARTAGVDDAEPTSEGGESTTVMLFNAPTMLLMLGSESLLASTGELSDTSRSDVCLVDIESGPKSLALPMEPPNE